MGWERANYFIPSGAKEPRHTWGKPGWLDWSAAEQRATRTGVALYDQTSFGKLLIKGRDAERLLQWLCTADVAVPVGRAVYTGLLNERGGYEADVTVTRVADDEFLLVTGAGSVVRDQDWLAQHIAADDHVVVVDVSSAYAVYGVMGPESRTLLQRVSRSDLSDGGFPFATSRTIDLGHATVRATRITYVGELGWELYVPTEFAVGVYELLMSVGVEFPLVNAGYQAINSLRLEKGYRAFGAELTPDRNPVEAGLLFACKLRSDIDFLGRDAVLEAKAAGPRRRLVSLVLGDPDAMMWGGELVLRDGVAVGQVTSAGWGAATGTGVALAYVHRRGDRVDSDYVTTGRYEVDIGGRRYPAAAGLRGPYDATGARIRM
jgi:4-methylaminobutanoate oxidase (formaldehyde-forming)